LDLANQIAPQLAKRPVSNRIWLEHFSAQ